LIGLGRYFFLAWSQRRVLGTEPCVGRLARASRATHAAN
jgi:hypothetical protein